MKNIRVTNCKLYKWADEFDWTNDVTENRGIWPDASIKKIDYPCTVIKNATDMKLINNCTYHKSFLHLKDVSRPLFSNNFKNL